MDEMKAKMTSRLMCGIIEKLLVSGLKKKFGFTPTISIKEIEVNLVGGNLYFHLDIDGRIGEYDLLKINRVLERS